MNACEGGHFDVVQYLLDQGANVNTHKTVSYNVYEWFKIDILIDKCDCTTFLDIHFDLS